jgi:hypothetical protein
MALGGFGIFILPWFLRARQEPNVSISYTYGFNNFAAWAAAAILLFLGLVVQMRDRRRNGELPAEALLEQLLAGRKPGEQGVSSWAIAAAIAVASGFVVLWYQFVPVTWFGEMEYFITRIEILVEGHHPYTDFEFIYGPAMLYPSFWLCKYSGGEISVEAAYCICLVIHWVSGILITAYITNNLVSPKQRTSVFICVLLPLILISPWGLGMNYSPLRFVLAPGSLLFFHQLVSGRIWIFKTLLARNVGVGLSAFALPLASFLLSPEMGFILLAAMSTYLPVYSISSRRAGRATLYAIAAMLSMTAVLALFGTSYFRSLLSHGSGGLNFPIYPTVQVLFLLVAALWILPLLAVITMANLRKSKNDAAFSASLLILLGLSIPVALGRCDGGHIYCNGFCMFIVFLSLAGVTYSKRRLYPWGGFLLAFGLIGSVANWDYYSWQIGEAVSQRVGDAPLILGGAKRSLWQHLVHRVGLERELLRRIVSFYFMSGEAPKTSGVVFDGGPSVVPLLKGGKMVLFGSDLRDLLSYGRVGTPFPVSEEIDRFLKISGAQYPEYYGDLIGCVSVADLRRKLADLSSMKNILVPVQDIGEIEDSELKINLREEQSRFLSRLLVFPISLPPEANPPFVPAEVIMGEIRAHYTAIRRFRDNVLMRRQD